MNDLEHGGSKKDTHVNTTTKAKQERKIATKEFMTMEKAKHTFPKEKIDGSKFWGNPKIKEKVTNDLFITKPEKEVTLMAMLPPHHPITDLKATSAKITSTRSSRTPEILISLAQEQQDTPHKDRPTGAQTDNVPNATTLVSNTICMTMTSGLLPSTYNARKRVEKVQSCKELQIKAFSMNMHDTDVTWHSMVGPT